MTPAVPAPPVPVQAATALRAENIVKRFGAVTALDGVTVELRRGEILGILGDNGAGKSTLIKILTGFQSQDSGGCSSTEARLACDPSITRRSLGIECVYQDLALANSLSVYHNLFLNREILPRRPDPPFEYRRHAQAGGRICWMRSAYTSPRWTCLWSGLSGGQRQAIAVARAVNTDARILLLDEPLAAMGAREAA